MPLNQESIKKAMRQFVKVIDITNEKVGYFTAFLCLPMIFFIMYEVISRRFFNAPTIWAYEMIVMCFGIYVIMTPGYGLLKGSLICVDIVSSKFTPRNSHITLLITYTIFFIPFVVCLLPACYEYAINSWLSRELSWSQWAPPIYPLKTFIPIGWTLFCLQGIAEMLKSVLALLDMNSSAQPQELPSSLHLQGE